MIAMATKSKGKGGYCAVAVPLKIASAPVYKDIPPEEEHNASQKRAGNYCSALLNQYIPWIIKNLINFLLNLYQQRNNLFFSLFFLL